MKAYISVFKLRLINGLQYRAAAFAGVATQFFWGIMHIMIYEAFYTNAAIIPPMSLKQVISYVWLQQAFLVFIALWIRDNEIINLITSGNIAYEFCRPCSLYGFWFAKLTAQRLSGALLRCFPILIVAFLLPEPYKIVLPDSVTTFLLFIASLFLGLMVLVSISMLMYISMFITMMPVGSMVMATAIGDFFGYDHTHTPYACMAAKNCIFSSFQAGSRHAFQSLHRTHTACSRVGRHNYTTCMAWSACADRAYRHE